MDDMILHELHAVDQIPDEVGIGRNGDVERILHRAAGCNRVDHGAHAADPLGEGPGVARIASLQDGLDPAELRGRRPRVGDAAELLLDLDPQVPLDPGDGIDDDPVLAMRFLLARASTMGSSRARRRSRPGEPRWPRRARPPRRWLPARARHRAGPLSAPRRTLQRRAAGRRTATWCPRSRVRCSRYTDGRPPIGQLVRVFHWKIGQGEKVAGPLQPTLYRHHPFRAASSSNSSTNCPASKLARRVHWSWIRAP